MADPFEVRIKFTHQLQHLNASVNSAQKAAQYAIRHREMDEDLHSCILEQIEKNNMNNRANIMYFIEHLCDLAYREKAVEFIRMIQRDVLRIIDAVAPSDGTGAANVKVVRKVLSALHAKGVFNHETHRELEECLSERDTGAGPAEINVNRAVTPGMFPANGLHRLDKRQIEQRIEEDRERHKRLREAYWAVNSTNIDEFSKVLDDASDIGEDDFAGATEDATLRTEGSVQILST